jgi:ribonuclease D
LRDSSYYKELRSIFENPAYVKIVHGGDTDIQLLAVDLDICTLNVFDTARAY